MPRAIAVPAADARAHVVLETWARKEQLSPAAARELGDELLYASSLVDPCQFGITVDGSLGRGWCNAHQRHCRFEEFFRVGFAGGPWAKLGSDAAATIARAAVRTSR